MEPQEQKINQPWYEKKVTIILLLFFIFPVGLYGLWKGTLFPGKTRWIISIVGCLLFLSVIGNSKDKEKTTPLDATKTENNQSLEKNVKPSENEKKLSVNGLTFDDSYKTIKTNLQGKGYKFEDEKQLNLQFEWFLEYCSAFDVGREFVPDKKLGQLLWKTYNISTSEEQFSANGHLYGISVLIASDPTNPLVQYITTVKSLKTNKILYFTLGLAPGANISDLKISYDQKYGNHLEYKNSEQSLDFFVWRPNENETAILTMRSSGQKFIKLSLLNRKEIKELSELHRIFIDTLENKRNQNSKGILN
jgi:hypothetical protein